MIQNRHDSHAGAKSASIMRWRCGDVIILVVLVVLVLVLTPQDVQGFGSHHASCHRGKCPSVSFLSTSTSLTPPQYDHSWSTPLLFPGLSLAAATDSIPQHGEGSVVEDEYHDDEVPPVPAEWQGDVLKQLKAVIDPDLGQDIVSLGFVQNLKLSAGRHVSFDVELTTPACPVKDQFATDCERLVLELPWTNTVQVTMTAQPPAASSSDAAMGMSQVGAVIAVSSCKGGVGKSTTAVNLAFSLQSLGATVGIFDADVYGPSLPTMVKPDDDIVRFVGRQIAPLQRNGVRLMSFGYVNEGSAVMRGPMVTQLLDQFLSVTHWGALDYLILDMPPGTGDIQLTLTQRLNITAAVIVTTPQELSFADVVRGVEMFDSVQVPAVAVVENMAYYEIPATVARSDSNALSNLDRAALKQALIDKLLEKGAYAEANGDSSPAAAVDQLADELLHIVMEQSRKQADASSGSMVDDGKSRRQIPIFGPGHKKRLTEQWGIEHAFSIPLLETIAANGDAGTPFVLAYPDSPQAAIYRDLARAVVSEVAKAKYSNHTKNQRPNIQYDTAAHVIRVDFGASSNDDQATIPPADLRRDCRCAACVEELTGRQILVASVISDAVKPINMKPTGNYALSIDWSDGHRSLYPYRQIRALMQELQQQQPKQEAPSEAAQQPRESVRL